MSKPRIRTPFPHRRDEFEHRVKDRLRSVVYERGYVQNELVMPNVASPLENWYRMQVVFRRQQFAWTVRQWKRSAGKRLRLWFPSLIRLSLFLAGLGAGSLLVWLKVIPSAKEVASYLIAVAAMIGGTTAIIFSISILPMQGQSDVYFSPALEEYAGDWRKQQLIYFCVIFIALAFFADALYLVYADKNATETTLHFTVVVSLALVGTVFALIDMQYELVRRLLAPSNAIKFLERRVTQIVGLLDADAKRVARLMQFRAPVSDRAARALAFNIIQGPTFTELGALVETLAELALKLAARHEVANAKLAIRAVGNMLQTYLKARQTTSQVSMSQSVPMAAESDSHQLLTTTLERLADVAMQASRDGDETVLLGLITEVYPGLAKSAVEVTYLSGTGENPILDLITVSLSRIVQEATEHRRVDSVLQGTRTLSDTLMVAITKGGSELSASVAFGCIQRCIDSGAALDNVAIINACCGAYYNVLLALFEGKTMHDRQFPMKNAFEGITRITAVLTGQSRSEILSQSAFASLSLPRVYMELAVVMMRGLTYYRGLTDTQAKVQYLRDTIAYLEEVRNSVREASKYVADAEGGFALAVANIVSGVGSFIVNVIDEPDFADVRDELWRRLEHLVYLPYFVVSDAESITEHASNLGTMLDSVVAIGFLAADLDSRPTVVACIKSIFASAVKVLPKTAADRSGAYESRIVLRAAYLGILANKLGWYDVTAEFATQMRDFEAKQSERYQTTIGDYEYEPLRMLQEWKSDFGHRALNSARLGRPEDKMYQRVTEGDIDAFIAEVWGPPDTTA